jgi:hypothetical protein
VHSLPAGLPAARHGRQVLENWLKIPDSQYKKKSRYFYFNTWIIKRVGDKFTELNV